jgi:COP9 signalosome complex subunit 6
MSMADHQTRVSVQKNQSLVCGVLVGNSRGTSVRALETLEIEFDTTDDTKTVRRELLSGDLDLYRQNFPDCEVVGWYATCETPQADFAQFHATVAEFNFTGFTFLALLNPDCDDDAKEVPMSIYELNSEGSFSKVEWKIEADEAEQLTLDYCAKAMKGVAVLGNQSAVSNPVADLTKSVDSLNARVQKIILYLEDVKAGRVTPNHAVLREIRGMCNRLPADSTNTFREEYMTEMNDVMLMTYLATVTKSAAASRATVAAFNTGHVGGGRMDVEESRGGGGFGNLFAMAGGFF